MEILAALACAIALILGATIIGYAFNPNREPQQ